MDEQFSGRGPGTRARLGRIGGGSTGRGLEDGRGKDG